MWNISKLYSLFVILIANFSLNAQLILTTSVEVDLKENSTEPTKVLRKVPAHKNVEYLDYIAFDKYNGIFKVKVFGIIGFLNRNDVLYDNNFYLSLKASSKEISLKDTKVLAEIFDVNKRKIAEEKLWAKQYNFESEEFKELMSALEKIVPSKLLNENSEIKSDIVQQDDSKSKIQETNTIKNEIEKYDKKCIQSEESLAYASNLGYNVNTILSNALQNTINSELVSQKNFFMLKLNVEVKDHPFGPHYDPSRKTIVIDKGLINEINNKSYGYERVKAVIAHEFAHALQHANNFYNFFNPGIYPELHADFMAGFYIGRNGLIEKNKLSAFAEEFYGVGDNLPFFHPKHHGSHSERRCAFLEGYKVAVDYNFNIVQAFSAGVDYIKLRYACDPFAIVREYSKTEYNNTNYSLPTGSYIFSSSQENMVFCNLYRQPLGEASPGKDLQFNNLTPGSYIVIPAKKLKSGKLKYFAPYTFDVKENHTGQLKINKVGLFVIKSYLIVF